MQLEEYMKMHKKQEDGFDMLKVFPRITCADGLSISIQAGRSAYCSPRDNRGGWWAFEAGFPSEVPSDELLSFAENRDNPTETVYGYVPISVLQAELDMHGGIKV